MVPLPGGSFRRGSAEFYPDEGPVHEATVAPFEIEQHPVTNAQFAAFVAATGYVTVAERPLDPADYPGVATEDLVPGALVFTATAGPVDLSDWRQWWRWQPGARWSAPHGPGSSVEGREDHPVVQVSFEDAQAYAAWAGRSLPTEVEWEYAARGGLDGARFAWGDEYRPGGELLANHWQGSFPYRNTGAAGWVGTSPVGTFPPNGFGLVDMIGNVWEWTTSFYTPDHTSEARSAAEVEAARSALTVEMPACCSPSAGQARPAQPDGDGARAAASAEPGSTIPRKTLKGGSHLCAPEYCLRYRPAARSPQAVDTATSHIGFRCVVRPPVAVSSAAASMPASVSDRPG
ncbi:formylglycine-generating enzyme family protein [Oerskovia turbata]|uniref:formylglycine-generating enzyme family protein n=1 Tax=Oerskovia turbata TaxID=1713 RepID=UPI001F0C895F|nr:formylglycine-generating enzyme family protein [Oerskovia turbata]